MKRINTSIFIERSKLKHGDNYDYSCTQYINSKTKVDIRCTKHGVFQQYPTNHTLSGAGCPECFKETRKDRGRDFKSLSFPDKVERTLTTNEVVKGLSIYLGNDRYTIIDKQDYHIVKPYKWTYAQGYALTNNPQAPTKQMSRLLLGVTDDNIYVDHRNGNKLDNRRCNLRLATNQQNSMNRKPKKGGSSDFKGVYFDKRCNKWLARIYLNAKPVYLGIYADEVEAAKTYDQKAKELFGEFAFLNFP